MTAPVMERKAAPKGGGVLIEDEGDGIITALVSVTGIVDNVKDIIEPGAYKRTLGVRKPKGIWHHTWTEPIAKTLNAEELMPGDSRLPEKLANGQPWPKEAGALRIRMKFNLNTVRGRTAYEDVKFFEDEQEWSIGYQVPTGGSVKDVKSGIRRIKDIDLFEYSPVLFGAMTHARTVGQAKALVQEWVDAGIDLKELMGEMSIEVKAKKPPVQNPEDEEDALDGYADEEFEDDSDAEAENEPTGKRKKKDLDASLLRKGIDVLSELLVLAQEDEDAEGGLEPVDDEKHAPAAFIEAKALEFEGLEEALDDLDFDVPSALQATASVLDDAYAASNEKAMDKAGTAVMDMLEELDNQVGEDEQKHNALQVCVQVVSDMFSNGDVKDAQGISFRNYSTEFKMVPIASRTGGWPVCTDGTVSRKSLRDAYLSQLDDDDLVAVSDWLSESKSDRAMLRYVNDLLDNRRNEDGDQTSSDEKKSVDLDDTDDGSVTFELSELKDLGVELDDK